MKEVVVGVVYALIPLELIFLSTGSFDFFGVKETLFQAVDITVYEYVDIFIILAIITSFILDLLLVTAILNMARYNGSLRAAFRFREIYNKIRKIGLSNLLLVYTTTILLLSFDGYVLTVTLTESLSQIGILISQLIISPFILIFIFRFIGIIDR